MFTPTHPVVHPLHVSFRSSHSPYQVSVVSRVTPSLVNGLDTVHPRLHERSPSYNHMNIQTITGVPYPYGDRFRNYNSLETLRVLRVPSYPDTDLLSFDIGGWAGVRHLTGGHKTFRRVYGVDRPSSESTSRIQTHHESHWTGPPGEVSSQGGRHLLMYPYCAVLDREQMATVTRQ